jgi:hypothetical protein
MACAAVRASVFMQLLLLLGAATAAAAAAALADDDAHRRTSRSGACRRGFRGVEGGEGCSPCPPGVECDTGRPCEADALALPASGRCCSRNHTCPPGRVLDNTRCLCAPMGCAGAEEWLLLLRLSGDAAPRLVCRSPAEQPLPRECGRCGAALALDPPTCACLAVRACPSSSSSSSGGAVVVVTRWRGGDGRLECVATRRPSSSSS